MSFPIVDAEIGKVFERHPEVFKPTNCVTAGQEILAAAKRAEPIPQTEVYLVASRLPTEPWEGGNIHYAVVVKEPGEHGRNRIYNPSPSGKDFPLYNGPIDSAPGRLKEMVKVDTSGWKQENEGK